MAAEILSDTIDVFLLAENRLLREALGRVLTKKNDMRVVAASAFTAQVASEVVSSKPHVLLVDSAVFACSDLQVVTVLRREAPSVKTLMIGMETDEKIFLRCVRAGVNGYLLKDASAVEIAAAVRSVAYDEAVCPPRLCSALFDYVAKQRTDVPSLRGKTQFRLTRREQQLVQMISGGLSNKEIAAELNLSEQTIKNHVHSVLRKLGAGDRLSAVEFCRQEGIVA
jgi:two-component system, NarL family, response regulator DegU